MPIVFILSSENMFLKQEKQKDLKMIFEDVSRFCASLYP